MTEQRLVGNPQRTVSVYTTPAVQEAVPKVQPYRRLAVPRREATPVRRVSRKGWNALVEGRQIVFYVSHKGWNPSVEGRQIVLQRKFLLLYQERFLLLLQNHFLDRKHL